MTSACVTQHTCIVCSSPTQPLLDLGIQPPANLLLHDASQAYDAFPLGFAFCPRCTHGQLTHFVDPALLFRHYLYASGTSGTLKAYFDWFADALAASCKRGSRVLEIASNDGSLLGCLEARGFDATGVDPAENLNRIATAAGRKVVTGFFPDSRPEGVFDVIVAMNVTAHTPTPRAFMSGVRDSLAPDGVAIIQTSQALMIPNGEFDTIYHEHYSFFTVASMTRLAADAGLRLERTQLASVHGISFLFFLRHENDTARPFEFPEMPPFSVAWPDTPAASLARSPTDADMIAAYDGFANRAKLAMQSVGALVREHQSAGRHVALVGVAAKALTFIRAAGIAPDVYLDEAALKVGAIIPATPGPIEPFEAASKLPTDTLYLIGAWNFADELMRKIRAFAAHPDPRFVIYFPTLREIG
jgi:SAM-dependent methyltransferase